MGVQSMNEVGFPCYYILIGTLTLLCTFRGPLCSTGQDDILFVLDIKGGSMVMQ
jgi:hypothetical protein